MASWCCTRRRNNDLAPIDNALDRLLLLFAFNYPFVAFIAQDPEAMARVPGALQSGVTLIATILLAGTVVLGAAWLIRQIQRAVVGLPLDVPKYLLLGAAIPMHWIVLLTPMPHKPIAIVAILTIYHNLQYHRLIWFHNKKYTTRDEPDRLRQKYGAAELISRRLLFYIAFGIVFGLIYQGPRQLLGYATLQRDGGTATTPLPIQLGHFLPLGIRLHSTTTSTQKSGASGATLRLVKR
jgi:hypothetical protein